MHGDSVPGVQIFPSSHEGPVVGVVGLTHGNEPVGGVLIDRMQEVFGHALSRGTLICVKANLEAQRQHRRHSKGGTDMNRLADTQTLTRLRAMPVNTLCYEQRRILELAPVLVQCDAIIDIHSTTRPSPPFLLMRDDQQHRELIRSLGVAKVVTGLHSEGILGGGMLPDVGLALGESSTRVGFTFEAGQHDDPNSWIQARDLVLRMLTLWDMLKKPVPLSAEEPEVYEVIDGFRQAPHGVERYRFVGHEGGEPAAGRRGTWRQLASFEVVQAGEEILRRSDGDVVRAPNRFTMLLPTPHASPNTDLFYMALRRQSPLDQPVQPETDAQAEFVARGIEQTLDLLNDDEFARGVTWASFDNRQVLDLAADCVARTRRLPHGHPHRQIAIVGRGDWGGTASEHRAARRYRRALKLAVRDGVPIRRFQVMSGASLGWLEAMLGTTPLSHLKLSFVHSNHVAAIVTGDIERALTKKEYHGVRVGLIVETNVPEPDEERVAMRVSRLALFSSRVEFLRTAQGLMSQIRAHHQWWLERNPPHFVEAFSNDEQPAQVRFEVLKQALLSRWREHLVADVADQSFSSSRDFTNWLVKHMQRGDVLDASSLRAWLARNSATGIDVRRDYLMDDRFDTDLAWSTAPLKIMGYAPVDAQDVNRDNFERWLGWKRMLNVRQRIPDTRGQDTELAFHVSAIQRILARWYRRACKLAATRPNELKVVISGDGFTPSRETRTAANALLRAHDALIKDPNVSYLRLQNLRGMNLRWAKALAKYLADRPADSGLRVQVDPAQRTSVNVVLLLHRHNADSAADDWSLEGWDVVCCGVVLDDFGSDKDGYAVGMFTEQNPDMGIDGNSDLMYFGREYCESLLKRAGARFEGGQAHTFLDTLQTHMRLWAQEIEAYQGHTPDEIRQRLGFGDKSFIQRVLDDSSDMEGFVSALKPWPPRF